MVMGGVLWRVADPTVPVVAAPVAGVAVDVGLRAEVVCVA